jgi:pimeloyl-ACP methyl ester carboxylesterase
VTLCRFDTSSSDTRLVMLPRGFRADGTVRPVLMCHGHSLAAAGPYGVVPAAGYGWQLVAALLSAGYPVCLPDAGGGKGWNSTASVTHLDNARLRMSSTYGAKTGAAHIMGFSMGGMLAASYAAENPTLAKTLTLTCPAVDMASIHDTNYGGYGTAELEAAHGGSSGTYTAALPTKNPMVRAAANDLDSVPTAIFHGAPADTVVPLASINQFASDAGASILQDQSQGHDPDIAVPATVLALLAANP